MRHKLAPCKLRTWHGELAEGRGGAPLTDLLCPASQASGSPALAGVPNCIAQAAGALSFNGAVLARHGEDVVERFFGTSDAGAQIPVSSTTRFDIGSAGKMFTTAAIGLLVDRGLVALDAPVGRYLEGLPIAVAEVTIAQLLAHSSGLGDYLEPKNKKRIESATTATELLPLAVASPLGFAPGPGAPTRIPASSSSGRRSKKSPVCRMPASSPERSWCPCT